MRLEADPASADYNFKFILIGNSEVGKTSITNRFIDEKFNEEERHSREV